MLELIAQIATLISLLLIIPAFITGFMILKEFSIPSLRFSAYYKLLLLQVFLHSLFLFGALFYYPFKTAFLAHSFAMLPIYALLLFRLYHVKWQKRLNLTVRKAIAADEQAAETKRRQAKVLKNLRIKINRKSQWR